MASIPSATTWGSPTATKRALLIHGMTLSSHTWHRVGIHLASEGYFVIAPNLIGHACRTGEDYSITSIAKDLLPYLAEQEYSLVVGHSLGGVTALTIAAQISLSYSTAFILVDPPLHLSLETIQQYERLFSEFCTNVKPAADEKVDNPLWTLEDCIYKELGQRLCPAETVHSIFQQNQSWNFFEHLELVSEKWNVTVLVADPALNKICTVEDLLPYAHVRAVMVRGAAHCIQSEFPEIIVDEALKAVALKRN